MSSRYPEKEQRKSLGKSSQGTTEGGGRTWAGPWGWVETDWVGLRKDGEVLFKGGGLKWAKPTKSLMHLVTGDDWGYWFAWKKAALESEGILDWKDRVELIYSAKRTIKLGDK